MAGYAEQRELDREFVDQAQEDLDGDYGVDQTIQELLRKDRVLFDQLGEIV